MNTSITVHNKVHDRKFNEQNVSYIMLIDILSNHTYKCWVITSSFYVATIPPSEEEAFYNDPS